MIVSYSIGNVCSLDNSHRGKDSMRVTWSKTASEEKQIYREATKYLQR